MDETYTRLTSLVDHACDLPRSTADRFDGIVEARRANILAVIEIIQLTGIAGAVVDYFNLADLSHIGIDGTRYSWHSSPSCPRSPASRSSP